MFSKGKVYCMTQFVRLPETFAILRTNGYRGPSFQLLGSRFVSPNYNRYPSEGPHSQERFNIVEDITSDEYQYRLEEEPNYETHRRLFKIRYQHPQTRAILDTLFWVLPFRLFRGNLIIPILEFHVRSWIPRSTLSLPVSFPHSIEDFLRIVERIQQEVLHEIRHREDQDSSFLDLYNRVPSAGGMDIRNFFGGSRRPYTPPRTLEDTFYGEDDVDDRMSIQSQYIGAGVGRRTRRGQSPPPSPRIVESVRIVEVPVERVVVQTRVAPIPKNVGEILLANARAGADSCPIAATPFSECTKLCVTSCFHIFDEANLNRWRNDHTSCPVCRCKIENVVSETRVDGVPTV